VAVCNARKCYIVTCAPWESRDEKQSYLIGVKPASCSSSDPRSDTANIRRFHFGRSGGIFCVNENNATRLAPRLDTIMMVPRAAVPRARSNTCTGARPHSGASTQHVSLSHVQPCSRPRCNNIRKRPVLLRAVMSKQGPRRRRRRRRVCTGTPVHYERTGRERVGMRVGRMRLRTPTDAPPPDTSPLTAPPPV